MTYRLVIADGMKIQIAYLEAGSKREAETLAAELLPWYQLLLSIEEVRRNHS